MYICFLPSLFSSIALSTLTHTHKMPSSISLRILVTERTRTCHGELKSSNGNVQVFIVFCLPCFHTGDTLPSTPCSELSGNTAIDAMMSACHVLWSSGSLDSGYASAHLSGLWRQEIRACWSPLSQPHSKRPRQVESKAASEKGILCLLQGQSQPNSSHIWSRVGTLKVYLFYLSFRLTFHQENLSVR